MKCGTVAVVGRANAGKSTLVNVLVGEKVAITSPKPQTTRDRIYGVLTTDDYQIVFEDTPGIYKAKNALNARMQKTTVTTAKDCDVTLFVLDGHAGVTEEEIELARKYSVGEEKKILALTKTDITDEAKIAETLNKLGELNGYDEIIPVSARRGKNIKRLLSLIIESLPDGDEYIFNPDAVSNKSERFMIAELMREKILLKYDKEIPHGVAVVVDEFSRRDNGIYDIDLDIICEKDNHKAIIIGKGGKALKETSSFARESMEKFLGAKVFLKTYVKVKENWRDRADLMSEYGYGKEE